MGIDAIIVLCIIVIAVFFFVTEKLPVDLVGLLILVSLVVTGVLTPEEGVKGFSNPATLTVAAMFVLSGALFKTGAVNAIGPRLAEIIKWNYTFGLVTMMVAVAVISAFINNTPVVAVFIPIIIQAAEASKHSPSKFLIPLSYATIFGGTCTLIGTSTNILVSGIAVQSGLPGLSMFSFAPMGVIFVFIGIAYMAFWGKKLLPDREREQNLTKKFGMRDYLSEIVLLEGAKSVGRKIMDSTLVKELELDIIEIRRDGSTFILPPLDMVLEVGDHLKVRCDVEKIKALKDRIMVQVKPRIKLVNDELNSPNTTLVELVISANSEFEGKTLNEVEFKRKYRAVALAIKTREEILHEKLTDVVLKAGDVLLAEVKKHRLEEFKKLEFRKETPFIIISEEGIINYDRKRFWLVAAIIIGVVITAVFDLLPIMISSLGAVCLLVLTKSFTMREVYNSIDWKVIFLLAGALSLGVAMENAGVANMLALDLVKYLGGYGPVFILSALYLVTVILTELMSNNATAALIVPVAITTAKTLGLDPTPFIMAVAFAASASFMTPVGYQTNTMVYGAGGYKFKDFTKAGALLTVLFWLAATFLIPIIYPF